MKELPGGRTLLQNGMVSAEAAGKHCPQRFVTMDGSWFRFG
jgi:hypothetical protein